ncbi:hypothetical protein ACFL0D_00430 [Thermoproteota archaeon]
MVVATTGGIDRRWIYLIAILFASVSFVYPLILPIPVSDPTRGVKEFIDTVPAGSVINIEVGFGVGMMAELGPLIEVVSNHAFMRDLKIVYVTFEIEGPQVIESIITRVQFAEGKEYGVDYVNIGYIPGIETGMSAWADNTNTAEVDYRGNKVSELPLMKEVSQMEDFAAVFFSTCTSPDHYFRQWATRTDALLVAACASTVPIMAPYYQAGMVKGYIPSIRGASEYEVLLGIPGSTIRKNDAFQMLVILGFITMIASNIGFLTEKMEANENGS